MQKRSRVFSRANSDVTPPPRHFVASSRDYVITRRLVADGSTLSRCRVSFRLAFEKPTPRKFTFLRETPVLSTRRCTGVRRCVFASRVQSNDASSNVCMHFRPRKLAAANKWISPAMVSRARSLSLSIFISSCIVGGQLLSIKGVSYVVCTVLTLKIACRVRR